MVNGYGSKQKDTRQKAYNPIGGRLHVGEGHNRGHAERAKEGYNMEEACQGGVMLEEKSDFEGWMEESPYLEDTRVDSKMKVGGA